MNINFNDLTGLPFKIKTKPIEISIIIDNLVSNAKKAKAKNLKIRTIRNNNNLMIEFEDDGTGIPQSNLRQIYNLGFTTTDGSGVGLYHVKEIINRIGAKISVSNNSGQGVTFKITLKEKT
jgi:signal transduction histidine kinase